MSGRYLLDTNIVIALFAGESSIIDRFQYAGELFLPGVVLGELYYGAFRSSRVDDNIKRIGAFARANVILDCNIDVAVRYGEIKNNLRKKGRPIPENDIWIAAIAMQYDLTLITRDAHFEQIDDLVLEMW